MREGRTASRRSFGGEANVGDPRLQVALTAIVVALEPERDVDARAGLQMNGAIDQSPSQRLERAGAGVEGDLQSIGSDGSRRALDADVSRQQHRRRISDSERLEVPEQSFDAMVEAFDRHLQVDTDLRNKIFGAEMLVGHVIKTRRKILNLVARDRDTND